jgi:hypothetical protein
MALRIIHITVNLSAFMISVAVLDGVASLGDAKLS